MKKLIVIILLSVLLLCCVGVRHENVSVKPVVEYKMPYLKRVVVLKIGKEYKAVVFFELPNPCHKIRYRGVTIQDNEIVIDFAYIKPKPGQYCIQVVQKYKKIVNLGRLRKGNYIVVIRINGKVAKVVRFKVPS